MDKFRIKYEKKEFENLTLWGYATPWRKECGLEYKLPTTAEIKEWWGKLWRKS